MKPIPYGKQNITSEDIQAVTDVLNSDYLTQGPQIKAFEDSFAEYIGVKYAVALANGTAALHLCALALGVQPGQKVIVPPITFAASANCIRYCGGEVVFADINPETLLLDIDKVKFLLESAPKGEYAGIIPVDFAGRAVNLEEYRSLADEHGLWIIEDACHAPGGYFVNSQNEKSYCGSGNYADLAIFSFHPVKHIAAGEGGMITTNDEVAYKKLLALRTHGITRNSEEFSNSLEFAAGTLNHASSWPGWYMEMQDLGFNYRLTDMQAALGSSQLLRADAGLKRRRTLASQYESAFKSIPSILKQSCSIEGHAYHLYIIEVEDRLGLYNFLKSQNIFPQVHYIPVHLMPYYKNLGWKEGDLPISEDYYKKCLSLPMYPTLTDEQQSLVISKIKEYYS